jgi:hypothetical protein
LRLRHYAEHRIAEPTKAPPTTSGRGLLTPSIGNIDEGIVGDTNDAACLGN